MEWQKHDYAIPVNRHNGITLIFQVQLTIFNKINKKRKGLALVISTCKIINDINLLVQSWSFQHPQP